MKYNAETKTTLKEMDLYGLAVSRIKFQNTGTMNLTKNLQENKKNFYQDSPVQELHRYVDY